MELEYAKIGEVFVRALCLSRALGHVSPAGLADYVADEGSDEYTRLVRDAFGSARVDAHAPRAQRAVDEWLGSSELVADARRRGAESAGTVAR